MPIVLRNLADIAPIHFHSNDYKTNGAATGKSCYSSLQEIGGDMTDLRIS
jgi:hypothetical protein